MPFDLDPIPGDVEDVDGLEPSTSALAFAAYHDAWTMRHHGHDGSEATLLQALRDRKVKPDAYAEGTLLRETIWASWAHDRGPKRMHLTVLRYQMRRLVRLPRSILHGLRTLFGDSVPEHLRIPTDLKRMSRHGAADDELDLPFTPSATFVTRMRAEWKGLDVDDDVEPGEAPGTELPVWLDPLPTQHRAAVMLGRERIGETTVPAAEHAALLGLTTRQGRRVVADGSLWVTRDRRGRFHAESVDTVHVPDRDEA